MEPKKPSGRTLTYLAGIGTIDTTDTEILSRHTGGQKANRVPFLQKSVNLAKDVLRRPPPA